MKRCRQESPLITKILGLLNTADFGTTDLYQKRFLWLRDQLGFIDGAIVDSYKAIEAK